MNPTPCANFFVHNGYFAFACDAAGNDESEGDGLGGISQGVVDLDRALSFVEENGYFPNLLTMLFGLSRGGYSACSVLTDHLEGKAVIECSDVYVSIITVIQIGPVAHPPRI